MSNFDSNNDQNYVEWLMNMAFEDYSNLENALSGVITPTYMPTYNINNLLEQVPIDQLTFNTNQPVVKKPLEVACTMCRKRRIKCSKEDPCSYCAKKTLICIYEDKKKSGRKKTTTTDQINIGNEVTYKPTLENLKKNIELINVPIIRDLVQPLTIRSLFEVNDNNLSWLFSLSDDMFKDESSMTIELKRALNNHGNDSLFLSQMLIIITINVIVIQILIKLKQLCFDQEQAGINIGYTKDELQKQNFTQFMELCIVECNEIFSFLELNSLSSITVKGKHPIYFNQYYNLSLASLHLCNYYHSLNLTKIINQDGIYWESKAEINQAILNLNKSINFFHLLENNDSDIFLKELLKSLYSKERYLLIFSSFSNSLKMSFYSFTPKLNFEYCDANTEEKLLRLFCLFDQFGYHHERGNFKFEDFFNKLLYNTRFDKVLAYKSEDDQLYKELIKHLELWKPTNGINAEKFQVFEILSNILQVKFLLLYPKTIETTREVLSSRLHDLNIHLGSPNDYVSRVMISNYQLLPQLVHILKIALHANNDNLDPYLTSEIETFNKSLKPHFPSFDNIQQLYNSDELLKQAYEKLMNARNPKKRPNNENNTGHEPGSSKRRER